MSVLVDRYEKKDIHLSTALNILYLYSSLQYEAAWLEEYIEAWDRLHKFTEMKDGIALLFHHDEIVKSILDIEEIWTKVSPEIKQELVQVNDVELFSFIPYIWCKKYDISFKKQVSLSQALVKLMQVPFYDDEVIGNVAGGGRHGPFLLSDIQSEMYSVVSREEARQAILRWSELELPGANKDDELLKQLKVDATQFLDIPKGFVILKLNTSNIKKVPYAIINEYLEFVVVDVDDQRLQLYMFGDD